MRKTPRRGRSHALLVIADFSVRITFPDGPYVSHPLIVVASLPKNVAPLFYIHFRLDE